MRRRDTLLLASLAVPGLARAQGAAPARWEPTRAIRVIVPYAASGGTDLLARALAESLRPLLPQPIVIENRAGGAGVIGTEMVVRAEPDGHTLLAVVSTHVANRVFIPGMPYDPIRDVTPIAMLSRNTMVLVAGATQPFGDLRAMLTHAKANPGRVGTGSTEALSSFIGQELARRAGVEMPDVAYRSGGPLMNDIVAGHLPVGWTSTVSAMPHMGTGRVRVLAVSTATRSPFFPDVPTVQDQGVAGFDLAGWVALLGPRGLPEGVAARLLPALEQAYADPTLQDRLRAMGVERDLLPGPALLAAMRREDAIWTEAASRGHVRPQQ